MPFRTFVTIIQTIQIHSFMIGAIIGAAAAVGSALYSGIMSGKANRRAKANTEKQKAENTAWYNRRYNEDGTQRADAQRILRRTQEAITNRNKNAAATQAVVGGTEESVAATKNANANALAETASAINAQAEARKDNIESSYRQQDANLNGQLNNIEMTRSQNIANAGSQAIAAAGKIGSAIDAATDTSSSKTATTKVALDPTQKATMDTKVAQMNADLRAQASNDLSARVNAHNEKMAQQYGLGKPDPKSIFDTAAAAL